MMMTICLFTCVAAAARTSLLSCCAATPPHTAATPAVDAAAESVQQLLVAEALGISIVGRAGTGHYGSVLLSADAAVKLSPHPAPHMQVEAAVLRAMHGQPGFPAFNELRTGVAGFDAIVMERLGPSLHDVWDSETASTAFDGTTVLRYGRGTLQCLRRLHEAGYVHNDVKPNNVLLGLEGGENEAAVHLIDFGLATGAENTVGLGERGTPLFASVAAHEGLPTRGVHDVEALVYMLAYLASGTLPWERKPPRRAESLKRRMLTDGCSTLTDSCTAERLTEDVHAAETVEALQALWTEVVAGHENGGQVDYAACEAALSGGGQ